MIAPCPKKCSRHGLCDKCREYHLKINFRIAKTKRIFMSYSESDKTQ